MILFLSCEGVTDEGVHQLSQGLRSLPILQSLILDFTK